MIDDLLARVWTNLGGRIGGPLSFRLLLQPLTAASLAIYAGIQDARAGRPAYFWTILTSRTDRGRLIREGLRAVANVFVVAVAVDVVYQVLVFGWVYPGEVLIVGALLACVPYLLLRGPVNRLALMVRHRWGRRR